MSGDAHARKRGADKRRKKVDESAEDTIPLLIPAPPPTNDENIHVHKDAHLGGNFCSKIVFFCLFGTLTVLVGLLIVEFQGSGDVESAADSPWSVMLQGWVDDQHDTHEHEEEHSVPDHSEEEEEGESEGGFSLYGTSESDHEEEEQAEGSHESEHEDDDHESENAPESDDKEDFGFYKSIYQRIYKSEAKDDTEEGEEEPEVGADDEEDDGGHDDDDANEDNDDGPGDDDNDDNDEGQEDDEADEADDGQEDDDLFGEKDDDDYYTKKEAEKFDDASPEEQDDTPGPEDEEDEPEEFHNKKSQRVIKDTDDRDDDKDDGNDDNDDDEIIKQILARSQERKSRFETSKEKPYETEAEEHIRNVMSGLRKKKLEEEVSLEDFDEEPLKEVDEEQLQEVETEEEKENVQEVIEDDDNQETVGVILKFGVGVALLVVAHVVLIRKWNSWDNGTKADSDEGTTDSGNVNDIDDEAQIIDRRESLVDEDAELPTPSGSEDEVEENGTPEISEDEQPSENYVAKTAYEASATPVDSEAESEAEPTDEEADGSPDRWKTEEGEAQTGTEEEEEEDDEEEEEEEEEEESPPPSPPKPKVQLESNPRRRGGPRSADIDFEQEYYEYADITNDYDWAIRNELDFAEDEFLNGSVEKAKSLFSQLLAKHPNSARAYYGIAKCSDQIAEDLKSNTRLLEAIDLYSRTLQVPNISDALYLRVANRTIERMRFKGLYQKLIPIHRNLIQRFHNDPIHRNNLAVTFLLMNRLDDAKTVLENVLTRWPTNGMAAAHYGFILKMEDNLEAGVKYLRAGVESNDSKAQDSRFYFHLGDALYRLGRNNEALEIYKMGVKNGMFRSLYQRSLYNVDRLASHPWWTLEQTTYSPFFRKLEENWKIIRKEAESLLTKKSEFVDEAEKLRSAGDWKQFELFARGRRIPANCQKVPITCGIVSSFEAASTCSRGQVKFSVMTPGTHVRAHCGPTNCRLRAHLGLIVPPNTFLRVAEETRSWEEGKILIFDDSFEHEVWHNGSSPRLVLIIDTWHPELTPTERKTLTPI